MPVLEYLMVYTESGLPIYSKCYGTFCKSAAKQPELLSGFLSALQTLPLTLGGNLSLQSVNMGSTNLRFSKALPSGHSVVIGLNEDSIEVSEVVFGAVNKVLNSEKFAQVDWDYITSELMHEFEEELVQKVLPQALHAHGGFSDECTLGDQCPLHTTAVKSRRQRVWDAVKTNYAALKARMGRK